MASREPGLSFDVTRPKDRGHWPGLCWVILAVAHGSYLDGGWSLIQKLLIGGTGLVLDVKMKLDRSSKPAGIDLWRL